MDILIEYVNDKIIKHHHKYEDKYNLKDTVFYIKQYSIFLELVILSNDHNTNVYYYLLLLYKKRNIEVDCKLHIELRYETEEWLDTINYMYNMNDYTKISTKKEIEFVLR